MEKKESTEEVRTLLKNAHGEIKYRGTNNYIFQAFLQENNDALNWLEHSLGYLCRSFDNLNTGVDYLNTKPAIHISFLDYCLFPDKPEFHATYKLLNVKNHNIYTDKFIINVVDSTHINMATNEDKFYAVDKWAAFLRRISGRLLLY